ncbi:MAG: glutathione S-transferase family protein [Pseudomonadales bacterium]
MSIQLYGAGTARTIRPIWVAEELGIDYELSPIGPRTGETQTAEFTAMNSKQKIPFLIDKEIQLSESLAICRYLIACYGNGNIWQASTDIERAKEDEWCCFIYGEVDETSLYVIRRHRDLAHIYGEAPAAVQASEEYLQRQFVVLSEHLEDNEYLVACQFGLADIFLMSCLDWAVAYKIELLDSLKNYRQHIAERPAYSRAISVNYSKEVRNHGAT